MDAGYDHPPRTGAPGGAYAIRPYTGTIIRAIGPPRGTIIRAIGPLGGAYAIRPYPTGRRAFQYPAKLGWRP